MDFKYKFLESEFEIWSNITSQYIGNIMVTSGNPLSSHLWQAEIPVVHHSGEWICRENVCWWNQMELIKHVAGTVTVFTYHFLNSEFVIYLFHSKIDNGLEGPGNKYLKTDEKSSIHFRESMGFRDFFWAHEKRWFREICLRWLKWRSGSSLEFEALFLLEDAHWQCKVTMLWYCYYHWKNPWREETWYLPYMPYMLTTNSTVSIGVLRTFGVPLNVLSCTARSSSIVVVPVC